METRVFGRTNAKISVIAMGGCGLGYVDQEEADKSFKLALKHEINIIDVAPTYGLAEERLRPWIEKYRNRFFLAEKTMKRSKRGALRQLNRSLNKLGTSHFDLYQFHAVSSIDELDKILASGGAMEAFKEAKETGLIKHIGITAHHDVRILQKALERSDDIETVLIPVNVATLAHPHPVNDYRKVLKKAQEKHIGITAIKAISKGRWKNDPLYNTWYEPLDEQELVDQAVWFTLSQEGVTTYSLPCDVKLWPLVLDAAKRYKRLNDEEQEFLINRVREEGYLPLFPE